MSRQEVEFAAEDGTVLRGILHTPDRDHAPGIVMAHGFSGVKEQIDHYARAFAKAGFVVLNYDHRGFGGSDGSPRQEVDPYRQLADWRDAISFLDARVEVDTDRGIGVWGTSFAGGLAMVVAANDPRVGCVVAQIPQVSGHRNARLMFGVRQLDELHERLVKDRVNRRDGCAPATVPVFATVEDEPCALPPAVGAEFVRRSTENAPSWRNEVTLRSVQHLIEWEAAGWVPHIAPKPLLMIVAARDTCTFPEVQLEVFETARGPKRLVVHPGGHFETYDEHFAQTSEVAAQWFTEHLPHVAGRRPGSATRRTDAGTRG